MIARDQEAAKQLESEKQQVIDDFRKILKCEDDKNAAGAEVAAASAGKELQARAVDVSRALRLMAGTLQVSAPTG